MKRFILIPLMVIVTVFCAYTQAQACGSQIIQRQVIRQRIARPLLRIRQRQVIRQNVVLEQAVVPYVQQQVLVPYVTQQIAVPQIIQQQVVPQCQSGACQIY